VEVVHTIPSGTIQGRLLYFEMLKQKAAGKWDYGYVHSKRAVDRNWIVQSSGTQT
jgi:hypothetical protein